MRRFFWSGAALFTASLFPFSFHSRAGKASSGWLGARSGTFDALHQSEIPRWAVYLVAGLLLYVAVVPAAATVVVIRRGFARDASEPARLFAAIVLPVLVA